MTMVSSGEISIGGTATSGGLNRSINLELGRSATANSSLNETALRNLASVASGPISLSNFYGKSSAIVYNPIPSLNNSTYANDAFSPVSVECRLYINSNLTWSVTTGQSGNWAVGVTGSNYWVRFTRTSQSGTGSGTGGSIATTGWLNLGSNQNVYVYATTTNEFQYYYASANYTIDISTNSSGTNIVSTSYVILQANAYGNF